MSTSRNDTYGGAAYLQLLMLIADSILALRVKFIDSMTLPFTTSAAVDITPLAPIAASGYCSSIAVNPYDDKEIMATYANYAVRSVYHTLDASVAAAPVWTVIEGTAAGPSNFGFGTCKYNC
ncbi:MAG: hypothetical protein U5N85_00180 [Arcicella sp.]|nr:hypothetical protein [Arcicella sp.]